MSITKIKEVRKKFIPEIGDLGFGSRFIVREVNKTDVTKNIIRFVTYSKLTEAKLFIDNKQIDLILKNYKYICPFRKIKYYGLLPLGIFTTDKYKYEKIINDEKYLYKYLYTDILNSIEELNYFVSSIDKTYLGHGYTECTLPSDGSLEWKYYIAELENGDELLVTTFEWFNK